MKITKLGFIHQLTFMPRLFPVSCYLVEEEHELTLIDTALPSSMKAIMQAASRIGKPITNIVLTHAHGDHIGSLDALKEQLPQAVVSISERDAKLLAGDRSLLPHEPQTPIRGGVPKPGQITAKPDRLLLEGDRIGSLEAITAPGHTPGSMAFLDCRTRMLLAGDAFQTRGGTAVSGVMMPWFPFPAMATWNAREALRTAEKLQALHPSVLAAGHGVMLEKPEPEMLKAIRKAQYKLKH